MAMTPNATPVTDGWRSLTRAHWKAMSASWIGYLLDGFDFGLMALVLTEVASEFHLSLIVAATMVSAAFITRWLGGLLLGALGDRVGRTAAMIISIVVYGTGTVLCGFAWDYWSLFAFRAVVGLGMAGEYGSGSIYVLESWPKRLKNTATGLWFSGYPVGGALSALVYAVVVPNFGWRWMFFIGIIPVAFALIIRRVLPEAPEWKAKVGTREQVVTSVELLFPRGRRALNIAIAAVILVCLIFIFSGNAGALIIPLSVVVGLGFLAFVIQLGRRLWLMMVALIVTLFFLYISNWPITSLLPTYLKGLGDDPAALATQLFWAGIGDALGGIVWGIVADTRMGTRRTYVLAMALSLALIFPVFTLDGSNPILLGVLLFAIQFTVQGIAGVLPKYLSEHFPTRFRAAGVGFSYNIAALGGALAPILGTSVAASIGNLGVSIAVLTSIGAVGLAVMIGFNIPARIGRALGGDPDAPALQRPNAASQNRESMPAEA